MTDDTYEQQLNELQDQLVEEQDQTAVQAIVDSTSEIRGKLDDHEWQSFVDQTQRHPLHDQLKDDPLTRRAFEKPRGYPGDAVMMDMIYFGNAGCYHHNPDTTDLGEVIFETLVNSPTGNAGCERRQIAARAVDDTAERVDQPVVTSIACGHMRETNLSEALAEDRIESWIGLDEDVRSLRTVEFANESNSAIQTMAGSVKTILDETIDLQPSDLIYSAGLFDYLSRSTATTLVSRLFDDLQPGGRLLVGNLTSNHSERGYMEAFMDWWLEYRTEDDMYSLADDLPDNEIESLDVWTDDYGVVLYLDVRCKQ